MVSNHIFFFQLLSSLIYSLFLLLILILYTCISPLFLVIVLGSWLSRVSLLFMKQPSLLSPCPCTPYSWLIRLFIVWLGNLLICPPSPRLSWFHLFSFQVSDQSYCSHMTQYAFISSFIRNGTYSVYVSVSISRLLCSQYLSQYIAYMRCPNVVKVTIIIT